MAVMRTLLFLALAAALTLAANGPARAAAAGVPSVVAPASANPLLIRVKTRKCIGLVREAGREVLYNACSSCRMANVQRKRPGQGFPVTRTYRLAKRSRQTLPFRGSGQTRILADTACGESTPEQLQNQKCVRFHRFPNGTPGLFNECPACRIVEIEREAPSGARTRTTYSVTNRSYVPLQTKGAKIARIVSDKACR